MKTYKNKRTQKIMTYRDGCMIVDRSVIEGKPDLDCWEEVIEKNYEILSYYQESIVHGKYVYINTHTNWDTIKSQGYKINSVRVLSSGVVFTIGDRVRISKLKHDGSFVISEFYFDCTNTNLLCGGVIAGNGHVNITKIEHSAIPIFKTEDGVDVFEGDSVYWVLKYDDVCKILVPTKINKLHRNLLKNEYSFYKIFSTEEKAEEYIAMSKPCLSLNDIKLAINLYPNQLTTLQELIKTKSTGFS